MTKQERFKSGLNWILKYSAFIVLLVALFQNCSSSLNSESSDGGAYQTLEKPNRVKWHPGHYYTLMKLGKYSASYLEQVYKELDATPALRGVQVRFDWPTLEPTEGNYDFSSIDQLLNQLQVHEKRLIILLQLRTFDTVTPLVPSYLMTDFYEGGVFLYTGSGSTTPKGSNLKLWNNNVRDRLTSLIKALGLHLNSHPYLEGIGITESAMGTSIEPTTVDQENEYYINLLNANVELRRYFPNTLTYQFTNFPRSQLKDLIDGLESIGAALGGPDILPDEPGLNVVNQPNMPDGVYSYYPKLSGVIPLVPSIQPTNYVNTSHDGTGHAPTVQELLDFGKNNLKANYLFWTRDPDYYLDVLQLLKSSAQTANPEGGLDGRCPSSFTSCVN